MYPIFKGVAKHEASRLHVSSPYVGPLNFIIRVIRVPFEDKNSEFLRAMNLEVSEAGDPWGMAEKSRGQPTAAVEF